MRIRQAEAADIPRVVEMAARFIRETPYKDLTLLDPDSRKLELLAAWLIEGGGVILLAELDVPGLHADPVGRTGFSVGVVYCRRVVGMLAVALIDHPMSGVRYGDEIAWWVDPEHRKTAAGYRLLCAAEEWTRQKGGTVLKMLTPFGSNLGTFYERRGYRQIETAYIKPL